MQLLRSISTVSGLTLISRFLGFFRDVLMAKFLGAGFVSDVFFIAFKLPNFFRRLFAEGAFNAAFVPIFCGLLGSGKHLEQKELARRFAEDSLSVLFAVLLVFTVLMQVAMPVVMLFLAPGFQDEPDKFSLAIQFSRITFPYLMLISAVALISGVLNGLGRFAPGAAAPIFLNLTLITSLGFFNDTPLLTGHALAMAIPIAGVVQLLWLVWGLKKAKFSLRLPWPRITDRVRELGRIMLPVAIGAGVMQINLIMDIILSSFLPEGSLSFLYYADRLNQLPIGVVGVAVGTVLLPTLSRSLEQGKNKQASYDQNRAIEAALLLTLPATFALAVVPFQLITVLFERGAFTSSDTIATSQALMAYVAGLPAYVLVKVLNPAYYSRKDTRTPVRFAIMSVGINLIFNLLLMVPLKHVGLALATAIASWFNVTMLFLTLKKRGHFQMDKRLGERVLRMLGSCIVMGLVLLGAAAGLSGYFTGTLVQKVGALLALVAAGLVSYGVLAWVTGAVTREDIRGFFGAGASRS